MKYQLPRESPDLFHVVGKTNHSQWPGPESYKANMKNAWRIFSRVLKELHHGEGVTTHAFVLMNNHYHWLCRYDFRNDPAIFEWFHEIINMEFLACSEEYTVALENEASIHEIKHIKQYHETYRYIYQNAVNAGLVNRVEDYMFSTLPALLGKAKKTIPCVDEMNLIYDLNKSLQWLNMTKYDSH